MFNEISSGASGDLQSVTRIVRQRITRLGMSSKLGPMVFGEQQEQVFLGKNLGHERNYGERVAELIDKEMHDIVSEAYADTLRILREHLDALKSMANALMEVETINSVQVKNLVEYGTLDAPQTEADTAESEKEQGTGSETQASGTDKPVNLPGSGTEDKTTEPSSGTAEVSPWGNTLNKKDE